MKKALYRKRICAEKEKLTPEKVFHTPQYRDLLTSIGHEITGGKLTTLRLYDDKNSGIAGWNQGETVAVNLGNQITASFLTLELKSDSLIGILGHECGHYRYTDSALRKRYAEHMLNGSWYPKEPVPENAQEKEALDAMNVHFERKDKAILSIFLQTASYLSNLLNDMYIEEKMCALFPGSIRRGILMNRDRNVEWLPTLREMLETEKDRLSILMNLCAQYALRDCEYMVVLWRKSEESLFSKPRVFEELKILYNVKAVYIDLYDRLAYSKSDDRLRVIRELIKRDCLTDALEENQIERLAEALSKKSLSRWMQEDFKNILDLRHETAIWILIFLMDFTELLKELTRDNQVYFLLHNQNLLNGCSGLPALMDKLLAQDPSWKNLKTELNISDAFVAENKSNIQKFIYEGGAEIMTSFLNRQPKKKEEIRRIVNAELLGKFMELKYHGGDLGREIAFPIKRDTEEIWKEKLLRVDCGWEIWEEDSLLPVMQIGEVPLRSCISYRNGPNCDCLLSCFDANKKIIFIKHNGKIVFRAILRLTKGSFVAADERKTIEFVDVTVKSEPHENKAEELVLFLERYYQSGLSEQEIRKAVNLTAMLVKEKAEKLGARLVLSSSYKNVLENKNYVLTNFYMYISASKNGSQYLDSLGGAAGVSASGSYTCNTFLLEAEERREESL